MPKRYVIDPEDTWRPKESEWGTPPPVTIEVRHVVERYSSGQVLRWTNGAHRVKAPGKRTRVFIGESSWSAAERLASDYSNELRRCEHPETFPTNDDGEDVCRLCWEVV